MNKNMKILLIAGAVAIAAFLAYRWYKNQQANAGGPGSPTGGLGSNLNSVAPELVGGSTGPAVGPALSAPVNITLNEQIAPPPEDQGPEMLGSNASGTNAMKRQSHAADKAGSQPTKTAAMQDVINPGESVPGQVVGQPPAKPKSGVAETKPVPKSEPGKRFTAPAERDVK